MEIERINTYRDARFSQKALYQHGCFLAEGVPCEVEIVSDREAVVRGANSEACGAVIESFRFCTPHITRFYDKNRTVLREYPPAKLLTVRLDQIQPSQFYVDQEKIRAVSSFLRKAEDIIIQVLPWEDGSGRERYISLGGHTRLYYAVTQGWGYVRAVEETADDWVYRFAEEAKKRGVSSPADLVPLDHEAYEEKWNRFCDRFFEEADGEQEEGPTCDC